MAQYTTLKKKCMVTCMLDVKLAVDSRMGGAGKYRWLLMLDGCTLGSGVGGDGDGDPSRGQSVVRMTNV